MGIALQDEVKQMLDQANFAHLATLMEDGSPQSVPVWIGRDGDRMVICWREVAQGAEYAARSAGRAFDCGFSRSLSRGADSWAGGGVEA